MSGEDSNDIGNPMRLTVYDPTGSVEIVQSHAPRLEGLAGKTIAELSNGVWEDARIFARIRAGLQARLPDTRFIPFTEFPIGSLSIDDEKVTDLLVAKGVDAVITGNAA